MKIVTGFWESELVDPAEGFDVRASGRLFAKLLRREILDQFPGAEVQVRAGRGGRGARPYALQTTVDGRRDAPEVVEIQAIADDVYYWYEWLVGDR